jgi:excinuclease ABC subunit A
LFAEGQRKYVESLSAYARQFLDQLQKPDVDHIEGLSPAIAIEQRTSGANPRSTIATTTEIYDYLRLLYAHVGQPHDPTTGDPLSAQSTQEIIDKILLLPPKTRLMVLGPVVQGQRGEFRDVLERLAREGFVRARIDGKVEELSAGKPPHLEAKQSHDIDVVVDRLIMADGIRTRLADSVETALKWGSGQLVVMHQPGGAEGASPAPNAPWLETLHSTRMYSRSTGRSFDRPTPHHFSFNSPKGACPVCHGLGQKMVFDPSLIVPDDTKSLEDGAVKPYRNMGGKRMASYYKGLLKGVAQHYSAPMDRPWKELSSEFKERLLRGTGADEVEFYFMHAGAPRKTRKPFEGVLPNLERLYAESDSEFTRNRLKAYMTLHPCDTCEGKRLRPEILAVTLVPQPTTQAQPTKPTPPNRIPGLSIAAFCALSIDQADEFLSQIALTEFQQKIAGEVIGEIRKRLKFMRQVGLGYLTLDRESGTLSGGEAQRIRLATQIGAGLVGVLYILDEPSIGLHQRDNDRLLDTLRFLRDAGNSVIVVEHDEDTIRQADYIVDLGPGAGTRGGEIVAQGTLAEILQHPASLTGRYLRNDLMIEVPRQRIAPRTDRGWIEVIGATENNLKNIDARIPIGTLTCVTGVSGSGKSTLIDDILRRAIFRKWYGS